MDKVVTACGKGTIVILTSSSAKIEPTQRKGKAFHTMMLPRGHAHLVNPAAVHAEAWSICLRRRVLAHRDLCWTPVRLPANEILALLIATSFAAGLNVYATVATLGLLARFDLLPLPAQLHLLESWWITVASVVLFGIEFFADKSSGL